MPSITSGIPSLSVIRITVVAGSIVVGVKGMRFLGDLFNWDGDIILVKLDAQGQLIWQQTFDTNTHTMLRGVLEHAQGGYVIAGSSYYRGDFEILLIRTDAEGNLER